MEQGPFPQGRSGSTLATMVTTTWVAVVVVVVASHVIRQVAEVYPLLRVTQ